VYAVRVIIDDDERKPMRMINLMRLFPHWDIRRLIYLCVLSQLISDDDYDHPETERNYQIGQAEELLRDTLNGVAIWGKTEGVTDRDYSYNDPVLSQCADQLNAWLSKPLPFEKLVSDPIFLIYSEIYSSKVGNRASKQKKQSPSFRGGWLLPNQICEFINFAEEELQKAFVTSPV
jgi:hypothetical protein